LRREEDKMIRNGDSRHQRRARRLRSLVGLNVLVKPYAAGVKDYAGKLERVDGTHGHDGFYVRCESGERMQIPLRAARQVVKRWIELDSYAMNCAGVDYSHGNKTPNPAITQKYMNDGRIPV
jgi:hypothetical protein